MEQGKSAKANFSWNMIGSIFESALSFVLLIVVNRIMGESSGGVFTLAFSHAQLMYYIGTLEVRPIQSTDVRQKYRFQLSAFQWAGAENTLCAMLDCGVCHGAQIVVCQSVSVLQQPDPICQRWDGFWIRVQTAFGQSPEICNSRFASGASC